jgi:hypothetical protein
MNLRLPPAEQWEAVYYSNPIPLSSRSLLAFALLFDRLHIPGVSIPQVNVGRDDLGQNDGVPSDPTGVAYQNLCLWAAVQPKLADFIHLPDQNPRGRVNVQSLQRSALQLLDDTYAAGISEGVTSIDGAQTFVVQNSNHGFALTWPLYQARALQHAAEYRLPLISDDPTYMPPLPPHPDDIVSSKGLAQQLAVEALSLALPPLRSVEPEHVAEFRAEIQPLVQPFRREMVKMTADLGIAITTGVKDKELGQACRHLAESRVLPALQDLSKQLKDPLKPFHKIAIDLSEAALATVSSSIAPALVVGWAVLRGAKIASEYVQLYMDRQGRKKTGLAYLLKIHDKYGSESVGLSAWDKRDWRCSGFVDIPEPGFPLTPFNRRLLAQPMAKGWKTMTYRRIFQNKTMSVLKTATPRYDGPWP